MYADDSSISYSSDSVTNIKDSVNEDLDHLKVTLLPLQCAASCRFAKSLSSENSSFLQYYSIDRKSVKKDVALHCL